MLKSDQAMWEQELAEHMAQFRDDPAIGHELSADGTTRRGLSTWLTVLLLWTPVAVIGTTLGWSIGWYVI